jgi:hypothetical protein
MTKTGLSYTITVSGLKELEEPKSWSRSKLPLHLAETLLDGKQHKLEDLLAKLKAYDTQAKIQGKITAWVRMGWVKKTEATAAKAKRTRQPKAAKPAEVAA